MAVPEWMMPVGVDGFGTTITRTVSHMSGQPTGPVTGAHAVIADALDPARRQDVMLRRRREDGHEVNAWWLIGAFVVVSATVVTLMSLMPGG